MKTRLSVLFFAMFMVFDISAQQTENQVIGTILTGYTARKLTSEPVADKDIELILDCGIKAPSARNTQLWKFTVVKNDSLMSQVLRDPIPGNVLIIISGAEEPKDGIDVVFDCALATENMFIAAQGLGLGGHIYTGPIRKINSMKQEFGIPEGYKAISFLRIGHIDNNVDAVTSATTRNNKEDVVNYVK